MADQTAMIPAPPIEDGEEVVITENDIWSPEIEGDWLHGVLLDVREVALDDRINVIYDFGEVTTGLAHEFGEGDETYSTGPEAPVERLSLWASAMLERRIVKKMVGTALTIVFDGRGKRKARIYRVFQH